MLFQISPCSGRLTESLQASAISHSISVNAGIISLSGRTLLIISDRSLVGIRVGTHGERYWLQWTNHRKSWGRASLRAACMSGSVKMGEASLGCSLPLAVPESIIPEVLFASAATDPSCDSSWMLFAVFPAFVESASSYFPSHPLTLTSTDPQTPASAPWQPMLRNLGPTSCDFSYKYKDTSSGAKQPILTGLSPYAIMHLFWEDEFQPSSFYF